MAEKIGLEAVLDTSSFDKGISSYLSGVHKMEGESAKAAGGLGKAWDNMGKSVLNAATVMSKTIVAGAAAATAAVGAFVVGGIKGAMDLESQMGNIASIMGKTKDEVIPLKELIIDLGLDPTLKVNATEAADAIEKLGANGLSMTQILDGAAKSTVLLANSTGADFETAAAVATDTMALFNISAADMEKAVNGITGVTVASKFGINDYRLALAQAGGVAAATGVEFNDFNASIAGMSSFFASGSDAGTSFKTMLLRLVPSTAPAAEAMNQLGLMSTNAGVMMEYLSEQGVKPLSTDMDELYNQVVDVYFATNDLEVGAEGSADKFNKWAVETGLVQSAFYDANGQLKDMNSVSIELNSALSGLSDMEKTAALSAIFGTDAMRAAVGMAEQGEVAYTDQALAAKELGVSYDSLTEAMEGGLTKFEIMNLAIQNTSAADAAAVRMDNFKGSLEILQGVVDSIGLQIGDVFLPILKSLADQASELLTLYGPMITEFFQKFADGLTKALETGDWSSLFPSWLNTTIALVRDNMALLTGALAGLGIVLATAGISAAISAITAAIAAISWPIVAVIASAAALGAAWNTNFLGIRDITLSVVNTVIEAFAPLTAAISAFGTDSLAEIWAFVTGNSEGFAATTEIWNAAVESVQNLFNAIVAAVSENLPIWTAKLLEWGAAAADWIADASTNAVAKIGEWATALLGALAANLPTWIAKMLEFAAVLVDWIGDAIAGGITKLGEWAAALVTWITTDGATQLSGSTTGLISALIDWITTDLIPKVGPAMLDFGLALGGAVLNIATALGIAALSIGASIWAGIMATDWKTVGSDILNAIKGGWESVKDAVLTVLGTIATSFKDKFTAVDWKAVGTAALNLIRDGWQAVSASVQLVIALIATSIKEKFTSIDWVVVGTNALNAIKDGWEAAKAAVLLAIGAIATSIKDKFTAVDWSAVGDSIITAIKDGLKAAADIADGLLAVAGTIATDLKNKIIDIDWKQVGRDIAAAIKDGLKAAAELIGGLISVAGDIVGDVIAKFTDGDWDGTGTSIMEALATAVKAAVALPAGLLFVVGQIALGMLEEFTGIDFAAAALTMMTALANGIRTAVDAGEGLLTKAGAIALEVVTKFTEVDWATDVGGYIMDAVRDGVMTAIDSVTGLYAKIKEIPAAIVKIFTDAATSWTGIGGDIVAGIKKGFDDAWSGMVQAIKDAADILPGFVKDALRIGSPSKVFAEIGRNIVEGLIVGVQSKHNDLRTAFQKVMDTVRDAGSSISISPSFTFGERISGEAEKLQAALGLNVTELNKQRAIIASEIEKNTMAQGKLLSATDPASVRQFAVLRQIGSILQQQLADIDKAFADQPGLRAQADILGVYAQRAKEAEAQVSVLADKAALLSQAAALGINISGYKADASTDIDTLKQLSILERTIASAKIVQTQGQIELLQQQQKINKMIDQRFMNITAEGSFAQRFRAQLIDPLLNAMYTLKDANPNKLLNEFYQSTVKLMRLDESQGRVSFLQEQIGLLKQAEDLGLNLTTILPDGLIGNTDAAAEMLSIVTQISQATETSLINDIQALKNAQKFNAAMQQLQPLIDKTDVSSVFGKEYKATVLDPILAALEKAAGIDSERLRLINEYTAAAQKLVQLQAKEKQLSFLQQQLDMIRMVHDSDLPGSSTMFDGLALGINASIDDLTTLTSRVVDAMIKQVKDQLQIASPSKVFSRIGTQMMAGLAQGIEHSVMRPINSLRQATSEHGAMSTRTLNFAMGGVTINTAMDEVMFERRVQRIIERSYA